MKILGAVIGGGKSRRFGRDKAAERVDGQALLDTVLAALVDQTDKVVVCGRSWPGTKVLEDRPAPNFGPLGGVNAALHYARDEGFDGVLCMPVDVHPAPRNIAPLLAGGKVTVLEEQHLIGFWPVRLAHELDGYLQAGRRSVRGFLESVDADRIADPPGLTNINRPQDLDQLKPK